MNPLIQELAKQCLDQRLDGWHFDKEKFAELIVKECAGIVYRCSHADCYSGDEFIHAGDMIKEHFGVE